MSQGVSGSPPGPGMGGAPRVVRRPSPTCAGAELNSTDNRNKLATRVSADINNSAASYPPPKGQTLIDGAASSLVERGAGTGLGRKLWSSSA
eukprot:scaffold14881_cov49-Phaeocystis_antarctica.AAC.2